MYIIIAGCGKTGSTIIKEFIDQGYHVVIIDRDKDKLDSLGSGLNATRIQGVEFDEDILIEAGIKKADVFLALTGSDNTNIASCKIAKEIYNVEKVIGKVVDINKEYIYKMLNIDYINPIRLGVDELKSRI